MKVTKKPFTIKIDPYNYINSGRFLKLPPKSRGVLFSIMLHFTEGACYPDTCNIQKPGEFAREINISNYQLQEFINDILESGAASVVNGNNIQFNQ